MFGIQNGASGVREGIGLRVATPADMETLTALVSRSFRTLAAGCYSQAQIEASLGTVIRVDPGLLSDGTYFVVERDGRPVACGGYSDRVSAVPGAKVERRAEVRAMFVAPEWASRGLGTVLLREAEAALTRAGHTRSYLHATLSGEPFYRRRGYGVEARIVVPLPGAHELECITMSRRIAP